MKIIFFLTFLFNSISFPQYFGGSLGFSTSNAVFGDIFYAVDKSSFHIGYTYEFNNTKGKEVSEQKANYGRTTSGTGSYFTSIDIGYGYFLFSQLRFNLELSIATNKYYLNYNDRRFNDDGYHMILREESDLGIGTSIGYNKDNFDFFVGYNSIRDFNLGLRFTLKQ